jgi:hypothetical protein
MVGWVLYLALDSFSEGAPFSATGVEMEEAAKQKHVQPFVEEDSKMGRILAN